MKKIIASIFILPVVSGCATFGQMEEGLNGLIGQNINSAISVLGFPSSEREIAGMRLVEWGRSNNAMFAMPTSSTTTGYVQAGSKLATYGATTNSSVPVTMNFNCRIALQVDSRNVIRSYQYDGNLGGCEPYIKALKKIKVTNDSKSPVQRSMREEI